MAERATAVNPRLLVWARERAGLSIEAVAAQIDKSPKELVAWESGTGAPTFRQLERLAEQIYKRPLAIFFFPSPPVEEDPRKQFRTLPDTEFDRLSPDTRYALREALAFQDSIRELSGGFPVSQNLITRSVKPRGEDLPLLTEAVRIFLGLSLERQISWANAEDALRRWRNAIEEAGIFVFKRSFKQKEVFGFCIYDERLPIIVLNNSTTKTRQIFTLFHELAHLLFSVSGITTEDSSYIARLGGISKNIEVACNRFAAEFLVPAASIPWGQVAAIGVDAFVDTQSKRYKVSREVILRRVLDRGVIGQADYEKKVAEWNRQVKKPLSSGGDYYATQAAYLGGAFLKLAFNSYHSGSVGLEELANHLRIKARNLERLEDFVLRGE